MFMERNMKTTEKIFDLQTGEDVLVERDMSADEIAAFEKEQDEKAERAAKEAEDKVNKAALLEKLGISEEEAKLLLS
jgi:N-acetylmuramic acid 6-phosphate (MurNAc-6-P) etherase